MSNESPLRLALAKIGALPPEADGFQTPEDVAALQSLWLAAADSSGGRRPAKCRRVADWMQSQVDQQAVFSCGLPGVSDQVVRRWLGHRLFWWPAGISERNRSAIVSSRIGRKLEEQSEWIEALRLACGRVLEEKGLLVTSESTATDSFVRQAATLFDLPVLQVICPRPRQPPASWFEGLQAATRNSVQKGRQPVVVSPQLGADEGDPMHSLAAVPDRDLLVALLAEQLWILQLRRHGNLERIVRERLKHDDWPPDSTRLLTGPGLAKHQLAVEFQNEGAVCWNLTTTDSDTANGFRNSSDETPSSRPARTETQRDVIEECRQRPELFLVHATRRPSTNWPGESTEEFLTELILSHTPPDRSESATLRRMLEEQRIRASSAGIRGGVPIVSFSASPPGELLRLRTYRRHRTRWDYEPYGLCIRRTALERLGARPVCYGDDLLWDRLSDADRPWFQKQFTTTNSERIDWSHEREWRVRGDVSLVGFDVTDAVVFVPSETLASDLQTCTGFPVVSVDELTQD